MRFETDAEFWSYWARFPIAGGDHKVGHIAETEDETSVPPGWSIDPNTGALRHWVADPDTGGATGTGRWESVGIGDLFKLGSTVYRWNGKSYAKATEGETKAFLNGDPTGQNGGSSTRLTSDDPRYWELAFAQLGLDWAKLDQDEQQFIRNLALQAQNTGLDADAARQQVLGSLIINRNNGAVDIAQTSANVAKTLAEFVANPRDAYAAAIYANQVGGVTPFGDIKNPAFGEYGKALATTAKDIFQPVGADLAKAREFNQSIPPTEFFGAETRQALGLGPTPAQALAGGGTGASPAATTAPANGLQMLMDRLNAMSPEQQTAFRQWTTGGAYQPPAPAPVAPVNPLAGFGLEGKKIPKFDMGGVIKARTAVGDSPTSTEGGLNLNLFEPAVVVGMDSGKVYATLAEPRPDGTRRGEQLVVKPLKSEVEKDKRLADGEKAITQSFGVPKAAQGGNITSATPDDIFEEFNKYLTRISGGGGGTLTPFGGTRHVAGGLANEALVNPMARNALESTYSMMGIDPEQLWADVKRFTPNAPINNFPRVNWLG